MIKATMIIILTSLGSPHTAEFDSMETCLKQAPIIEEQSAILEVACIPSSKGNWININDYNVMLEGFLNMMDAINRRQDEYDHWVPLLVEPEHE